MMENTDVNNQPSTDTEIIHPKKSNLTVRIWVISIIAIILIRVFVCELGVIPSPSMLSTIKNGDWILIDKFTYGAKLPDRWSDVPVINAFTWIPFLRHADSTVNWSYGRLPGFRPVKRSDIVVFSQKENPRVRIIKRVVGIAGDTVQIRDGRVIVNRTELKLPDTVFPTVFEEEIMTSFPSTETGWTIHNYGPIVIPSAGDSILLNSQTFDYVKDIVAFEQGDSIVKKDSSYYLRDEPILAYKVQQNYYFVLGDNRKNSIDSRYTGFVAANQVVGRVNMILFSYNKEKPSWYKFRNDRFFRIID